MQQQITKFVYDDRISVSFLQGDDIWISANEMAKPFNKTPAKWLELTSTKEFISQLSKIRLTDIDKLLYTERGGTNPGTWFCKEVAQEFGRWLSVAFGIWCNERIQELATHGFTATETKLEEMLMNPDLLIGMAQALKAERTEKAQALAQLELANNTIQLQAPKIKALEQILGADTLLATTQVAQNLGLSAVTLNKKLAEKKIQHRVGNSWVLNAKYVSEGYAKLIPVPYITTSGEHKTNNQLKWTEKGREFIRQTFTPQSI